MEDYYGPCDVRVDGGVMRLHCESGGRSAYVANRYDVELLDIERQCVTLCLPGGIELPAVAGEARLRVGEPVGWHLEPHPVPVDERDVESFGAEWRPTRC